MSRFSRLGIAAVGSHGLMDNVEAGPRAPTVHVAGSNSFQLVVRATNFWDKATATGSNWTDISSPITAPGMYNFPNYSYRAAVFQVNSLVGSLSLAVG